MSDSTATLGGEMRGVLVATMDESMHELTSETVGNCCINDRGEPPKGSSVEQTCKYTPTVKWIPGTGSQCRQKDGEVLLKVFVAKV